MKAIRVTELGGPEVLRYEEVPDPVPDSGEVLVRMEAAGLNFIEVYYRKGLYKAALPYTPGTEGAGTVVAVANDVRNVHVGDRVASQSFKGSYAELAVAPADKVVVIPDGVETKVAAAAFLQGMTAHYLVTSVHRLQRGERCLVHAAAGGVGLLLCQMGSQIGAHVIGTVSNEAKAKLAREAGAQDVILYTQEDFVAGVMRVTQGRRVHVVYDSVGSTTFMKSMDCLVSRGMLALFGQSSGPVAPFDPNILNQKGSLFLTRPTLGHYVATRQELEWRATELFTWIASGTVKIRIDREVKLEHARDAHHALEARETSGKVVLTT
jgi:NADPH2:quinone reductase